MPITRGIQYFDEKVASMLDDIGLHSEYSISYGKVNIVILDASRAKCTIELKECYGLGLSFKITNNENKLFALIPMVYWIGCTQKERKNENTLCN